MTASTSADNEQQSELSVVILGHPHKAAFFERLCKAAAHYERHVAYQDTHFLTVQPQDGKPPQIVKFTDPGMGRTGFREMELKQADLILLCYSAYSLTSLTQLTSLKEDLEIHKETPIVIICDCDEYIEEDDEHATRFSGSGSASEGYESEPESRSSSIGRHKSMDRIVRAHDDNAASVEQGKSFASELGPRCTFMQINSSKFSKGKIFLDQLLTSMKSTKRVKKSLIFSNVRRRLSKSVERTLEVKKDANSANSKPEKAEKSNSGGKMKSKSISMLNLTSVSRGSKSSKSTKSTKPDNQSKACVIM